MSQDIVADALNIMMNAKKAGKNSVTLSHSSKVLLSILAIAKLKGYVKSYKIEDKKLVIEIGNIHGCQAVKPRYAVAVDEIDKYVKRYLPSKDLGLLIISTSQGLLSHKTSIEKNIGGSLIAYFY